MLLGIGLIICIGACLAGFVMSGGALITLVHAGEILIICGVALGIIVISSPAAVLKSIVNDFIVAFKGSGGRKQRFIELLQLLYEVFLVGRRKGLIAMDEHVNDPKSSSIFSKYKTFLADQDQVEFLCNALRPLIDGKIKPDQLESVLATELKAKTAQADRSVKALDLVADSLPGVGIVAAVLGIINTMSALEDPQTVGKKVAAALSGTFLGIFLSYGFFNPLARLVKLNQEAEFLYYHIIEKSVSSFAKGLAPIMAVEIGRRALDKSIQPTADELEELLKNTKSN
jgi:chemotaxis protein MotA